jgi:hypothetical protein
MVAWEALLVCRKLHGADVVLIGAYLQINVLHRYALCIATHDVDD